MFPSNPSRETTLTSGASCFQLLNAATWKLSKSFSIDPSPSACVSLRESPWNVVRWWKNHVEKINNRIFHSSLRYHPTFPSLFPSVVATCGVSSERKSKIVVDGERKHRRREWDGAWQWVKSKKLNGERKLRREIRHEKLNRFRHSMLRLWGSRKAHQHTHFAAVLFSNSLIMNLISHNFFLSLLLGLWERLRSDARVMYRLDGFAARSQHLRLFENHL